MKLFFEGLLSKYKTGSNLTKKNSTTDSDREQFVKIGKEQFERLVEKGITIPVATL